MGTMCGDLPEGFDPETRCQIVSGVACRYIGLPEDILDEVRAADLDILHWEVRPRKDERDVDTLLIDATKPETA